MKILLINPPIQTQLSPGSFPLGLGYIAAVLRDKGYQVDAFDIRGYRYSEQLVEEKVRKYVDIYDVIGIGGMITVFPYIKWLTSIIKKYNVEIPIIVGGTLASSIPELLLTKTNTDIACIGEGENTVKEILEVLENNGNLEKIRGIAYRKEKKIYQTSPRELIKNLDEIPFPAWDLFPMERYYYENLIVNRGGTRGINLISGRGCPFQCVYCYRNFGRTVRLRSIDNVMEEIKMLQKNYGITHFEFQDELFTIKKERVHEFCSKIIKDNLDLTWRCLGRADLVDFETLELMKKAGCHWIGYGMESGSQKMLDIMNKNLKVEQTKNAIQISRQAGLEVTGTFMIGMPGETYETIQETIEFCKEMEIFNEIFFTVPYPGTLLYERLKNDNFIKDEEKFVFQISGDMINLHINMTNFSDKELIDMKKQAEDEIRSNIDKKNKNIKNNQSHNFTIYKNNLINNKISGDLFVIINIIKQSFPQLESLILVGGFGRGEGSVLIENSVPKPVNDYDIVLITKAEISSNTLKQTSKDIATKIDIRLIDLIPIKKAELSKLPYTMFNYDLKYGGYVFQGNPDVLAEIPEMDPAKMPLIEGKILLFNRLICLLECYSEDFIQRVPTDEEKFFLVNQCGKAILACCDALLLLKGKYHHRYQEKNKRFAEEYATEPEIVELVQRATDFKLKPRKNIDLDIVHHWFKIKKAYMDILFLFLNKLYVYGDGFSDWIDFGAFYESLELNSSKSNLELSEVYLLCAIEKDRKNISTLKLAKRKLKSITGKENNVDLWENARKECVDLWFKINH